MTSVLCGLVLAFCVAVPGGLRQGKCGTLLTEEAVAFKITYPTSNSTVSGEVIEIEGVGAAPGDTIEVSVLTNKWYIQDGKAEIAEDGSWSYGPCYLSGKRQFNNHTIKARLLRDGKQIAVARIRGVVRRDE